MNHKLLYGWYTTTTIHFQISSVIFNIKITVILGPIVDIDNDGGCMDGCIRLKLVILFYKKNKSKFILCLFEY